MSKTRDKTCVTSMDLADEKVSTLTKSYNELQFIIFLMRNLKLINYKIFSKNTLNPIQTLSFHGFSLNEGL